jgi:alpha-methylacyl-CoA racemase
MLLADLGADVIRIERPGAFDGGKTEPTLRNRRHMMLDLKDPEAIEVVLKLVERSDVLLEGFRPGVTERLGIGPEVCRERNPGLIYARITGWGQEGPLAKTAGHDINYIALTGMLHQIGPPGGKPVPPLNVIGDYGGGGLMVAFGIVCALYERMRSGKGQVIDSAMVDSVISFMAPLMGLQNRGLWKDETGTNFLAGGAHFYDTYETRDGKWFAVGAIEPQFHRLLLSKLGLDPAEFLEGEGFQQHPYEKLIAEIWPALRAKLAVAIKSRTSDELRTLFDETDACAVPVLTMQEATSHPRSSWSRGSNKTPRFRGSVVRCPHSLERPARSMPTIARSCRISVIQRRRSID